MRTWQMRTWQMCTWEIRTCFLLLLLLLSKISHQGCDASSLAHAAVMVPASKHAFSQVTQSTRAQTERHTQICTQTRRTQTSTQTKRHTQISTQTRHTFGTHTHTHTHKTHTHTHTGTEILSTLKVPRHVHAKHESMVQSKYSAPTASQWCKASTPHQNGVSMVQSKSTPHRQRLNGAKQVLRTNSVAMVQSKYSAPTASQWCSMDRVQT